MQTILLTITLAVLQVVNATPTPQESEVPAGLKIIDQYQSQNGNGTITWYTETVPSKREPTLSKRACGENTLNCAWGLFRGHSLQSTCDYLIDEMASGPKAYEFIPSGSYSVCYGNIFNRCCILWGNRLQNALHSDLVNGARKISQGCAKTIPPAVFGGKPLVSGRTVGTLLGDVCTVECLSNKPNDGCGRIFRV